MRSEDQRHRRAASHTLSRKWNKALKNRRVKIARRAGKVNCNER